MIERPLLTNEVDETREIVFKFLDELNAVYFRAKKEQSWIFEEVGDEVSEVLGLTGDYNTITRKTFNEVIHYNDLEYVYTTLNESLSTGNKFQLIFRINADICKNKWIWAKGKGLFDHARNLIGIEGTMMDISGRKHAVDELRTNENFYQHILHTMPIELVVLNAEQRYIFCNKTAIPDDETRQWLIGKNDFEYCEHRNKDLRIAWERHRNFKKVTAQKKELEWEEVFWKDAGKKVYALRRLTPIYDEDGDLQMVIGYGFDITDRRMAEEKAKENERLLKSINANIQDGIYRYSPTRGFLYVNDAFLRIFNYRNRASLMNDEHSFFKYDYEARKELINIQGKSGSFNNKEVLFKGSDDDESQFWGLVSCNKKLDEDQNILYDGAIADITELKETERLLKEKNEELLKTNNELDRFIYSASHDLRAPLTSILGIVKVAEWEYQDSEINHYLDMIRRSVNKLDHFVNDLIDYYRNSRSQTNQDEIDFNELINESYDNFRYMNGAEKINLEVANNLEQPFYSDEYRLRIIFNNLLSNAIKYQNPEAEQPYLKIDLREGDKQIEIKFKDNGLGIEQSKMNHIFDMFYRASQDSEGSGLGLYIVKEAVEKLSGSINATSEPGEGTEFTILLTNELGHGKS